MDLLETAKTGDIRKRLIKVNQTAKIIIVFKSANTMKKKNKNELIGFDDYIDNKYGKSGAPKREKWEAGFEAFKILYSQLYRTSLINSTFIQEKQFEKLNKLLNQSKFTEIIRPVIGNSIKEVVQLIEQELQ